VTAASAVGVAIMLMVEQPANSVTSANIPKAAVFVDIIFSCAV
jgi:hypothetical protein